ncbi:hypothetical protein MHU86_10487 [Fragilaria crotonensis]|nr:hypothetical protein MHU86_10487 [Fragilaria crotonensis]
MNNNTTAAEEEDESMYTADDMFYSPAEKENLLHIKREFDGEFAVEDVFSTRRHLIDAMRHKAKTFGFFIVDRGMSASCSETTSREATNVRRQHARQLLAEGEGKMYIPRKCARSKCGCEFKVNFTAVKGSEEVRITKVQFMHGKGCKPSGEQFKAAWTTGGHASRHLARKQNLKLHTIVQLLASKQKPSARMMRGLLCDMLPKDFNVSSKFINNVKTKVKLKLMNGEFDLLLAEGTVSEGDAEFILSPSDNLPPQYMSVAQEIANDTLKEALSDPGSKCLVVQFLCRLHQEDPSFLFDIQRDDNDTMVGICWQTGTMRFDWDTCASSIALDGMKRQLNSVCYPYISVTAVDGYGQMVVCAEAIVISERIEAYAWLLRCCSTFSCNRKLDGIFAVFGDGLVTSDTLLTSLGIQDSCALLDDVHHLLSPECGTWYKQFGVSRWNHYGGLLRALVFESYSLEAYETIRLKILNMMDCRGEPPSLHNYFNDVIHGARQRFARYSVHATPCNEGRLGSSIAEANHSSYVARIGGGSWDDPATQVKDCIVRMQELSNKRASFRDQYRRQSAASSHTMCDQTLALMVVKLSKRGFLICEEQYKKSSEYYCRSLQIDGQEHKEVKRIGESSRSARLTNGKKCSCDVFLAYRVQCRHLFAFHNGEFQLQLVDSKFHAQQLSVSSPNPDYATILSKWCVTRDPYVGSLGDQFFGHPQSTAPSSPPSSPTIPSMWEDGCNDDDPSQDYDEGAAAIDVTMCITTQPERDNFEQECILGNSTTAVHTNNKKITFRNFTDVSNSIANLALSLPNEDATQECLGLLVQMKDALSMSAGGHHASVPFSAFMSSANEFLSAFGPNANSRREGIFADHGNNSFEMQRHNTGKVRHKRLKSQNERNSCGAAAKRRPIALLNEMSQNLHLVDARNRPAQCSYCSSCEHTIKRCSVMDKPAFVGKKNSSAWTTWYRTLGNPSHHEVVMPTAGITHKLNRELLQDIPLPSQSIRHLSIKTVFYSSEAVEFLSQPASIYRVKNPENTQIPSPDNNIVELQLIERGGNFSVRQYETACRTDRGVNTTFYTRAKTVQKWMEHASCDSCLFVYVKKKET